MAYKSEQGRYVRMASFWGLFLLLAYGILGEFVHFVNGMLGRWQIVDTKPWVRAVPILGEFGPGALVAVIVQLLVGLFLYRFLNRPRSADYLIETETEMHKVVWPSWKDTKLGAYAVVVTVVVMFAYMWLVDSVFLEAFKRLFSIQLGG